MAFLQVCCRFYRVSRTRYLLLILILLGYRTKEDQDELLLFAPD